MLGAVLRQLFGSRPAAGPDWLERANAGQQAGRHEEAAAICRARLAEEPGDVDALQLLAVALLAQGRSAEALEHLREAVQRVPARPELHANLGLVYAATGQVQMAIESYRRAVALPMEGDKVRVRLAALLKATGQYDEAEETCRAGLSSLPASHELRHVLAGALFEQGRLPEAEAELRAALELNPGAAGAHSDLLRTYYYADKQDPAAAYAEHRAWDRRHARALELAAPPHANDPDPDRRLRLGYVSPFFRKHAVTFFFEAFAQHHDPARFEVFLYSDVARPDEYTERLRKSVSAWRSTVDMSDEDLAALVRRDAIDILVDLTGHTPGNRLLAFARKPAPVQATSLTTGMASVGYRITDAYADPPGTTEHLHSETALRLPGFYSAWRPPDIRAEPGPLPGAESGRMTFGSFNSCFKVSPTIVALWSRILHEAPGSRLILLAFNGEAAARRVRDLFGAHGIEPARLDFRSRMTFEEYFSVRREIDIALDTFPFHGVTTTCDSLWMGVPVVVLAGKTYFSRVGVSILANLGLPHLIAQTGDEYVDIVLRLAADLPELARVRAGLRDRLLRSPVADGQACARNLETAFREAWRTWCRARGA